MIIGFAIFPASAEFKPEQRRIVITWENVNFRKEPKGQVITCLERGDILTWMGETHIKDELWYKVDSAIHGEGYVNAKYAAPVVSGMSSDLKSTDQSPLDEQLLDFFAEYYLLQIDYGFLVPDYGNQCLCYCWDNPVDMENAIIKLAMILNSHNMIPPYERIDILGQESIEKKQKLVIAETVLQRHYGTSNLWEIFERPSFGGIDIQTEDWHSPLIPSSEDRLKLETVKNEIKESKGLF